MQMQDVAAIVTGGASGLGEATATMLAEGAARVAILNRNAEVGAATAARIGGIFAQADVTDEASVATAIAAAEARHRVARILVNCAGVAPIGRTVAKDGAPLALAAFRSAVEINLIGSFFNVLSQFAARAVTAEVDRQKCVVVVNTASVTAFDGQIGQVSYAASKAGLARMTLPVTRDLA